MLLVACARAPLDSAPPEADSAASDPTSAWLPGDGPGATVAGQAFVFGPAPEIAMGEGSVSVLEAPEHAAPVADDGSFVIEVPSGAPLSFVFSHPELATIQSATIPIGEEGLADLGFQVPTVTVAELMAAAADIEMDPERCQFVTTVSSAASPPYGGAGVGEPDATVAIAPALPDGAAGPVYFDYLSGDLILPDPDLDATTIDGGVIFGNLGTGEWTLRATKAGVAFSAPVGRCHPGAIVNAAPPHGIEVEG